jgi:hypothetical protein
MLKNWRAGLKRKIPTLPPAAQIAARGLLAKYDENEERAPGADALAGCTDDERLFLLATFFPALEKEVEIAWGELSPVVMARRDGGQDQADTCAQRESDQRAHASEIAMEVPALRRPGPGQSGITVPWSVAT